MKLKHLLTTTLLLMGGVINCAWAQQEPVSGTAYYLYNTETGKFLGRGNTWGTQAVTNDFGQPWQVTIAEGKYTLRMYDIVAAGSTSGLGSNGYSDNGSPIAFTPSGDSNGYKLANGSNYLTSPTTYGGNVLAADANGNTTWQFLNVEQYKAVLAAKTAAQEAAIASTAGVDISGSSLAAIVNDANNWMMKDVTSSVAAATPSNSTWTRTGVGNRAGDQKNGSYGVERYAGGGTYSYTVTGLTQGLYKVGVRAMFRSATNAACYTVGQAGYVNSSAYFSANGCSVQVKDWYSSCTSSSEPNSTDAFVEIANNGGYYSEVYTYVGDDGKLELKAVSESYWETSWFLFNGVTLTYYNDQVTEEEASSILASIPTGKMNDEVKSAIDAAKTTFENNNSIANYNALSAAIAAAAPSLAEYALIDGGTIPTNAVAGWAKSTTNGALVCNTWSIEGNSDGSGMTTPFIQDHVNAGTALGAGKLYYTFSNLNPGETYVVTALVRAFNESATGVTGAKFFAGNNSKSLADFGATCAGDFAAKGMFATLSCAGTVDANGQLQFGVELDAESPVNWIAIKNVTIAEGTGDVPTSIVMSEDAVSLTTGFTTTLTATIAPETADDKTITWASSNPEVATVAGGYVVAVAPGTAVITATAYAGIDVKATCTVTVADAAVPTFYSTTIEDGKDYYIYNAATGLFLGGANSWGTQASLIEHGIPFTAGMGEGVYTLDSHTYNNASQHFLGVNGDNALFVDNSTYNLYITSLGEGKFSISAADGSAFITAAAASTVVTHTAADASSAFAQWYFLSKNDRDKMLAAATTENPAEATYYVKQANISRNLSAGAQNENAWSQYSVGGTQDNSNFAAQVYNAAVDNYQTIENIPNGTYTVSVQAFTSGKDVKFYANDQKVDVKVNDSGVASCSGAAALFKQGKYPNTVTVTVTDRTLKIGFEGDCSGAKWLCYDDVTLYMTAYTANTGVTADDVEVQIGNTASLNAATVPATASFNAITSYTSSDESIATVDANGVVTGVAVGNATITVTANEMENFSTTVNVAVTLVIPTALALSETEVVLDAENTTTTLTVIPTPEGANTAVTWVSSDESVATVVDGVVTGVSTGTATITATSIVDAAVSATAEVTVTFPESTMPGSYYVNDGATRTVYTQGENLIKNGVFEYPNALYGWTKANDYATQISSSDFTVKTDAEGNKYLVGTKNGGTGGTASLGTAWRIEPGKTYTFAYDVKKEGSGSDYQYLKTSLTNTPKTETKVLGYPSTMTSDWTTVSYSFTNGEEGAADCYQYLQIHFRWLNGQWGFRNFYLAEATYTLEGNVDYATAAIPTSNIGTAAFQYSQDAIDAANALVQGTATVEEVEDAYTAVTTLNAPEATQAYHLVFNCAGHTATGNALTLIPNPAQTQGFYGLKYLAPENTNLAQAFYFTHTDGNKYKLSAIDQDGNMRYITTQAEGYGTTWYDGLRTTDDASKAMAVDIRPNGEGLYLLWNTGANKAIAHNGNNNNDMFTNNTANFQFVETTKANVTINTTAAGWGTTMLPFAVASLPEGVKAYICEEVSGTTLVLTEATALEANKPYIIEGSWNETLTGDAKGYALTFTEGLLTGVYAATAAPNESYVLQNHDGVVAFYQVDTEVLTPTVGANRAYLTAPAGGEGVKAFFFGGADGIQSVLDGLTNGDIYDLAGRKVARMQKGNAYIVNGKKVIVK